jgi:malate synthase
MRYPDQARAETAVLESKRIKVTGPLLPGFREILSPEALAFVCSLTEQFQAQIDHLLGRRISVHDKVRNGELPKFLDETRNIREASWNVAPPPSDLKTRRVEITGPVDRKMVINALNSGADAYMADFEDSHSPTWSGTVQGQLNLRDAVNGTITYKATEGKEYKLNEKTATLLVRPRGLHLEEKHVFLNDRPIPANLFDYGLFLYHNSEDLLGKKTGPYFYLPKMENHLEARLWTEIFEYSEKLLGLPKASIRCSVLIENILAAFEMEEILYELRERVTALNFGRWDYIFSLIKLLGQDPRFVLPERPLLPMNSGFLKACSLLLVKTCHKRGTYAIGGMAAQIPTKNNPRVQEAIAKVVEDKKREASEGYQGAWVAHPGLVPVVMRVFSTSAKSVEAPEASTPVIEAGDLLKVPEVKVTGEALRANIGVSLRYLESWLNGVGCVAINDLMEDTATVEICRSQIWQWIRHGTRLVDGRTVSVELFKNLLREELSRVELEVGVAVYTAGQYQIAGRILDLLVTGADFPDFMTLLAYDLLP